MSDYDPTEDSVTEGQNPEEYGETVDDFSRRHNRVGRLLEPGQGSAVLEEELDDSYQDRHSRVSRSD